MNNHIDSARKSGHLVVGKYMTIDTEEAIRRAGKRAEQTGRDVSPTVARELHAAVSDVFARLIENDDLDAAELWDNNGERPVLVGRKELGGTWQVADPRAWQRFLAKREEE
jgi:predicted ABC-type ATPase